MSTNRDTEVARLRKAFIERVSDGKVFGFETALAGDLLDLQAYQRLHLYDDEQQSTETLMELAKNFYRDHFVSVEDWVEAYALSSGDPFRLVHPRYLAVYTILIYKLEQAL